MDADNRTIERWLSHERDGFSLPERLAGEISRVSEVRKLAGGTSLQTAPLSTVPDVHVLYDGLAKMMLVRDRRPVTLRVLRRGDLVGDLGLLLGDPGELEMRAVSDVTVLSIPAAEFLQLVRISPQLTRVWLDSLAVRIDALQRRLGETLAGSLEQRVAVTLLDQSVDGTFRFSQTLLAELLGAQRSSVSRVLSRFQNEEIVSVAYRRITVLSAARLAAIAGLT